MAHRAWRQACDHGAALAQQGWVHPAHPPERLPVLGGHVAQACAGGRPGPDHLVALLNVREHGQGLRAGVATGGTAEVVGLAGGLLGDDGIVKLQVLREQEGCVAGGEKGVVSRQVRGM